MEPGLKLFFRISQLTILVPLIIAIVFRYRLSREQKFIGIVVTVSFLTELAATLVAMLSVNPNNWFLYHGFAVIMFYLMNRIYKTALVEVYPGRLFDWLAVLFVLFSLLNTLLWQSIDTINSNVIVAGNLLYMFFSLSYFYFMLNSPSSGGAKRDPIFWLNTGVLLYNSGALVLFLLVNNMVAESPELLTTSWILNAVFSIMLNGFYSFSLWTKQRV